MGCLKLHILDEQYKRTELRESCFKKELTLIFYAKNARRCYYGGHHLDQESGLLYMGARYNNPKLSIEYSTDPMWFKSPHRTSYHYCANNPIMKIDPTGMMETDYRNEQGELLYHTNDGLKETIIVPNKNIPKLEKELQTAKDNGTIDNAETNQEKMHVLGRTPLVYSNETLNGMGDNYRQGYKETYGDAYKKGKGAIKDGFSWGQLLSSIISALSSGHGDTSGTERHNGRSAGIIDGNYDKEKEKLNRLNPEASFKSNTPLIILKNKYIQK